MVNTDQYKDILEKVPGSFKSKLERIRRFLNLGKASVMVGAGFSRNADVPSHVKVKLWTDLGQDIYCRLQGVAEPNDKELVFKTPMRLASQFEATFGRSELDNLIRDSIPDDRMYPGALHKQLLKLPWRDVFTTNYDTLLERACEGLPRSYSVITSKEMLLYKNSPRIVKLHGSFPDKTPFLMTEDDYRTYPEKHPEFVNTVRQALVESIFCLIGFSGDDPNFTSWQGWLRDVMGDYAGPSYLITYDENYDESFKVLMERRGVEVLNFYGIAGIEDHKTALDFFFSYLSEKIPEWDGWVNYTIRDVIGDVDSLIKKLKDIRLSYPGWFVLPFKYYDKFSDTYNTFPYWEASINSVDDSLKEALLFELDWRSDISLTFKDFDWYRESLEGVLEKYRDRPMSNEAITLGLSLLRLYRHHSDRIEDERALKERLSLEEVRMTDTQISRLHYIVACNELSRMNYRSVEDELALWNPSASCYEGLIYKALVFAEIGELASSVKLLSEAYERVSLSLAQNTSLREQSLCRAIECLLAFYQGKRMPEVEKQYSFSDIRDSILGKVNETTFEQLVVRHGFGIGTEKRTWNLGGGLNEKLLYPYRCLLLYENYGLPYRKGNCSVDEKVFLKVLPILSEFNLEYSLDVVLRCCTRDIVDNYFTRTVLSHFNQTEADQLASHLLEVKPHRDGTKACKNGEIPTLISILSKLTVVCSQSIVVKIFSFVISAYRKDYYCKKDDISLIYSCLLPDSVQMVFTEAFSFEIIKDKSGEDLPLPSSGYSFYMPGDKEISIACSGFSSTDKIIRECANFRSSCLLRSNISPEDRVKIETAIRNWRQSEEPSVATCNSYLLLEASNEEIAQVKVQVQKDLDELLSFNEKLDVGNSAPLSELSECLYNLNLQVRHLSNDQVTDVLNKLNNIFENNFEYFQKDDSDEILGGFRKYIAPILSNFEDFVENVCSNGYSDKAVCHKLFTSLDDYIPSHLPVRRSLVTLNNISHTVSDAAMRGMIEKYLFSKKKQDVCDSCNALILYANQEKPVQTVLQKMIFYCKVVDPGRTRFYLQTLRCIDPEMFSQSTSSKLADMMLNILDVVPQDNRLKDEQKADIMYDGVRLATAMNDYPPDTQIEKAVNAWREYANSADVFNDVKQPWFVKRA
jgi:hypothetical protein